MDRLASPRALAVASIAENEGIGEFGFDKVYLDSEGVPTAGIGINLLELERKTGRALPKEPGQSVNIGLLCAAFEESLAEAEWTAASFAGFAWQKLSIEKRAALIDLSFQLGQPRLETFKNSKLLLRAAAEGEASWEAVRLEFLDSRWAKQTPARAKRITDVLGRVG